MPLRNATGGATNFHAVSVTPDWADTMDKTTQIGNHVFYRGARWHDATLIVSSRGIRNPARYPGSARAVGDGAGADVIHAGLGDGAHGLQA